VAVCYADPTRAQELLGWQAKLGIEAMCQDTWRWQQMNPDGYRWFRLLSLSVGVGSMPPVTCHLCVKHPQKKTLG